MIKTDINEKVDGNKICRICFNVMSYDEIAGHYTCNSKSCGEKKGLAYDWTIPDGQKPRFLRAAITRDEYEKQAILPKR